MMPISLLGNPAPPITSLLRGRWEEGSSLRDCSAFPCRSTSTRRCGHGSNRHSRRTKPSSTKLYGWFDGWGATRGDKNTRNNTAGGKPSKVGGSSGGGRAKEDGGSNKKTPNPQGTLKPTRSAGNFGTSIRKDDKGQGKGAAAAARGERKGGDENDKSRTDLGASAQALAVAVGETFTAAVDSAQERLSDALPQNVTLMWGGGASTNVPVPWKGIGIYAGGLLSGLVVAGGLLTLPYADLGSAGLRKSLTLFENVLLDIDQVHAVLYCAVGCRGLDAGEESPDLSMALQ